MCSGPLLCSDLSEENRKKMENTAEGFLSVSHLKTILEEGASQEFVEKHHLADHVHQVKDFTQQVGDGVVHVVAPRDLQVPATKPHAKISYLDKQ